MKLGIASSLAFSQYYVLTGNNADTQRRTTKHHRYKKMSSCHSSIYIEKTKRRPGTNSCYSRVTNYVQLVKVILPLYLFSSQTWEFNTIQIGTTEPSPNQKQISSQIVRQLFYQQGFQIEFDLFNRTQQMSKIELKRLKKKLTITKFLR